MITITITIDTDEITAEEFKAAIERLLKTRSLELDNYDLFFADDANVEIIEDD